MWSFRSSVKTYGMTPPNLICYMLVSPVMVALMDIMVSQVLIDRVIDPSIRFIDRLHQFILESEMNGLHGNHVNMTPTFRQLP